MLFGEVDIKEALHGRLAHPLPTLDGQVEAGTCLDQALLARLAAVGVRRLTIARPTLDELDDAVATRTILALLAEHCPGVEPAADGRPMLVAAEAGLVVLNEAVLKAANAIDAALSIACVRDDSQIRMHAPVIEIRLGAWALSRDVLIALERLLDSSDAPALTVYPWSRGRVHLLQTAARVLWPQELERAQRAIEQRLAAVFLELDATSRCEHRFDAIAGAIVGGMGNAIDRRPSDACLMVCAGLPTRDERDVIPAALATVGAQLAPLHLPVDVGGVQWLGTLGRQPVLLHTRSSARGEVHRSDRLLARIAAGAPVTEHWLNASALGALHLSAVA